MEAWIIKSELSLIHTLQHANNRKDIEWLKYLMHHSDENLLITPPSLRLARMPRHQSRAWTAWPTRWERPERRSCSRRTDPAPPPNTRGHSRLGVNNKSNEKSKQCNNQCCRVGTGAGLKVRLRLQKIGTLFSSFVPTLVKGKWKTNP